MKHLEDYRSLWGLTDEEYIHFLESYYFFDNDNFQKILCSKGYTYVVIPGKEPYAIYFKDGMRISKEEYDKFIYDRKNRSIFP